MRTRYDERNTMFSRARLKQGTKRYREFYAKHPHLRQGDDAARGMDITANLRASDTFKARFFPMREHNHAMIKALYKMVDDTPIATKRVSVPRSFSRNIKALAKHYGAGDVGIVRLKAEHFYTHHGGVNDTLGLDNYGKPITPRYATAIVYAMPMDRDYLNRAPSFEAMLETDNAYVKIAQTGSRIALYLKALGYRATFQSELYYETPLVPLAYDAGLGEIGMTNHLIHPRFGNAMRLGAVLTTLEIDADQPIDFGLQAFCRRCALCVMNCPSHSIKPHERLRNGRVFYRFDDQGCFKLWKNTGTDCSTCISSCPFTQGIDEADIARMKEDPTHIDTVLDRHLKKHTRRPYRKTKLDIVKEDV